MKRASTTTLAAGSAFVRAGVAARGSEDARPTTVRLRIHPAALAFVAGFPGVIGLLAIAASLGRSVPDDGARPLGIGLLLIAALLLVLGSRSRLVVTPDAVTVRFFGLRGTTVRFAEIATATFAMTFPSISYAITLTDKRGRKAIVHANWWRREGSATVQIFRALVEGNVAFDRTTARIVGRVLGVKRPKATIVHHGLFRKDRTW
jgi:hypothetical protein